MIDSVHCAHTESERDAVENERVVSEDSLSSERRLTEWPSEKLPNLLREPEVTN